MSAKIGKPRRAGPNRIARLFVHRLSRNIVQTRRDTCVCISLAGIFVTEKYCIFTLCVTSRREKGGGREDHRDTDFRVLLERDESNSHFPLKRPGQDNRERGKIRQVVQLKTNFLSLSLCFFYRRESERDPPKSVVTRTSEFIRNHVPRCHGDYFMLIRSPSKGV